MTRKVMDTISDNAAGAALVVGEKKFKPEGVDMRWIPAILARNGVIEESGVAAAVLNHPANGPAWLANKLHPFGVTLEPGEVILGGSFTRPVEARKGDSFHIDYGPYGAISCMFK
jgi:2-oxo-hept-3-ene-1,7-dioate hydratase